MGLSSSCFSDLGVFFPLGLHLFRDNPWGKWIWLPLGWRHLEIWILLCHVPKFPTGPVGLALVGVQVTFVKWIVYLAVPHLSTVGLEDYKAPRPSQRQFCPRLCCLFVCLGATPHAKYVPQPFESSPYPSSPLCHLNRGGAENSSIHHLHSCVFIAYVLSNLLVVMMVSPFPRITQRRALTCPGSQSQVLRKCGWLLNPAVVCPLEEVRTTVLYS